MVRVEALPIEYAIAVVLFLLFASIRYQRSFAACMLAGLLWGGAALLWNAYQVTINESWLSGRQQIVAEIVKVEPRVSNLRLRLTDVQRADGDRLAGNIDLYLYGKHRNLRLIPGQVVKAGVKLHLPRNRHNPGAFDYRTYCFDHRIAAVGSADSVTISDATVSLLEQGRGRLDLALKESDRSGVVRALLLADRSQINSSDQELYAASGTAHLLAISGLHVGMVAGWFFIVAWWLLTRRESWIVQLPVRHVALSCGIVAAVAYATMAGWPVTVQRSILMLAAAVLAWWLRSRSEPLNSMYFALMTILLIDPAAVVSISLWLSFTAVVALLLWADAVIRNDESRSKHFSRWVKTLFWVTVIASFATLPVIAAVFGRLPTYAFVANLIVVPLYTFWILPLSILAEVVAVVGAVDTSAWFILLANEGVEISHYILSAITEWPAGNLWVADIPLYISLLYGAGMVLSGWLLLHKRYPQLFASVALTLLLYLFAAVPERYPDQSFFTVWDVGQGAASTLVTADGKVAVFDVPGRYGSRYNGGTEVASGLRAQGIVHADLLVLSHAQSDHAGGAKRLLDQLRYVGSLWLADVPYNRSYAPMQQAAERIIRQGGEVRWLKQGDRLSFADISVEVLWPPKGYEPANGNNASLVLSMRLPSGERLLVTGDIEHGVEKELVKNGLAEHDLVLIPHHGSRTSSSREFVKQLSPDIAVAQSGWGNHYGFPHPDIVQRYKGEGAHLFDSKQGAVTIHFRNGMLASQYHPDATTKRDTALQWWR